MVKMRVEGIGRNPTDERRVLVLRERGGERRLVLQIDPFEATMIAQAVDGAPVPRPFTHDLLVQAVTRLGGEVKRVLIHDVRDQTFIGTLEIGSDRGLIEIDCRPSDGVAVRTKAPIFAAKEVLEQAGVVPGAEEQAAEGQDEEDPIR